MGNLAVPDALIQAMRASPCFDLQLNDAERVALLLEDYDFFVRDKAFFCSRLEALTMLRGKAVVDSWKAQVHNNDMEAVVRDLLLSHYDPGYLASMQRNFTQYGSAQAVVATDRSAASMAALAQRMLAG